MSENRNNMGSEIRTATLNVTSEAVWSYFERPQSWPQWDPDIVAVSANTEVGIVEGRTWNIELEAPKKAKLEFSNVTLGTKFTWRVIALGGAMQGVGQFRLEPINGGDQTRFEYEFEMKGVLGSPIWLAARKKIVRGVDGGMDNILAEFGSR
ncbi:MAG: SRPBCC family protein [Actinomycetia bacterium]|nr:SRPBCC family protein [Actinomycetes bacterium]